MNGVAPSTRPINVTVVWSARVALTLEAVAKIKPARKPIGSEMYKIFLYSDNFLRSQSYDSG